MGAKMNSRIKDSGADVGTRRSVRFRRGYATVAVLASAGLLLACGTDDAEQNQGTLTEETTVEETTTGTDDTSETTTTEETTEAQGNGSASGDFDGWTDIDAAVADLETIGVSCEAVDMAMMAELGGDGTGDPFALCEPESMIMFAEDPEEFRAQMEAEIAADEGDHDVHMVLGDNWVMICEGADVTACDDTAEYTGIPSQTV